jgi:hypothetical protein
VGVRPDQVAAGSERGEEASTSEVDGQTQAARETLEEDRGGTLTDRLADVVARGKAVGVTPEQMFKDFTGRGADQAVALAAIQRHFPAFRTRPLARP